MSVPEGLLTTDEPKEPLEPTPPAEPIEGAEPPEPQKPGESKSDYQKRIDQLTAKFRTAETRATALQAELDAIKRKDAAGARPEPPDLATLTNAEGHLDPAKYKRAMMDYEDKRDKWLEAQKAPAPPLPSTAEPEPSDGRATFFERAAPLRAQHADFDEVIDRPVFTPDMVAVFFESEIGPAMAYHLGQNQAEAMRIGELPPIQMARELGKLEAKLAAPPAPAPRTVSNAPEPIAPVGGTTSSTKDPDKMTTAEFMAWDRARTAERIKANPLGL